MSNKNKKILLSVQAKIILVAILLITFFLGSYGAIDVYKKRNSVDLELKSLADITAKKLTANLRIPLWNLDTELVADSIEAEMLTRDIESIFVFDSKGNELVAASQRQSNWMVTSASKNDVNNFDDSISVESFVNYNNEVIGRIVVFVTPKFKLDELYSSVLALVLTLLLLDVTIFIVLFIVINRVLKKPILELSEAANKISRGDFSLVIDTSRDDEIGVVANSIDRMQVSLKMSIDRLRKLSKQNKALAEKLGKGHE